MILETFVTKMLEGFAHTTGALIVLIPSFLFLARYSENRRLKSMQKGLNELPNLFKMFNLNDNNNNNNNNENNRIHSPSSTSPQVHQQSNHNTDLNFLQQWTNKFK